MLFAWPHRNGHSPGGYVATTSTGASIFAGTVDIGNHCDDCTTNIILPFNFTFYGVSYGNANVSSNGNLQFVSNNNAFTNSSLPAASFSSTIFSYWDDLYTVDGASGQGVFTSISGAGPNRIFNIEWRTQFCCSSGTPVNDFEVRLYEGLTRIDVIYGDTADSGASATAGVQLDGSDFTQFSVNSAVLTPGLQVTFDVPEPATYSLIGIGGILLAAGRRYLKRS